MRKTISKFSDGTELFFADGSFDEWCVYITTPSGSEVSPTDNQYFAALSEFLEVRPAGSIYEDFISIYEKTNKLPELKELELISKVSKEYGTYSLKAEKVFTTLYATMIAENNKANTKLGKRIKRLGVHKVLLENEPVESAANFMRGMKWTEIDKLCKARGF